MRRFTKVGLILYVAYRGIGDGDDPILECLGKVVQDGCFEAVEVTPTNGPDVRTAVVDMMRTSHMAAAYSGQGCALSRELDLNDLDGEDRWQAVAALEEGIDQTYELGYMNFPFLSGRYWGETKEQSFEQLLRSTHELCAYAKEEGDMPICYEVLDYNIDKKASTKSAHLAVRHAKTVREESDNFGLIAGLSHIPMIHETVEESILPIKECVIHAHMGNTMTKSPGCEVHSDDHPRFGFSNSGNDIPELIRYLRPLLTVGPLNEKTRLIVNFEAEPWKDEWLEAVTVSAKHTLNLAWELV